MTDNQIKRKLREEKTLQAIGSIGKTELTSVEISEITGKAHAKVFEDCQKLKDELEGFATNGRSAKIRTSSYISKQSKTLPCFYLDSKTALTILTGYYPKARFALICRWEELEKEAGVSLEISAQSKQGYKDLMATVLIEVEQKKERACKVASTVNKAVSNYFGLPKMVKKADMNSDMLLVRLQVMKDYEAAHSLFDGTDSSVKEFLYKKYPVGGYEACLLGEVQ